MTTNSKNTKRIMQNALFLFFRMFLILSVSLYTSRVVLNVLGVEDFGIYNVVGGVVIMFAFLNSSMTSATQRFLTYEIGKGNDFQLRKVFCMSLNIHVIIAFGIFILSETLGLWFVNTKLNIPSYRIEAVNFVYQFSVMTFIFSVLNVPYKAVIIAHEKMKVFAYVSIFEVILKLLLTLLLVYMGFDKLVLYSFFILLVGVIVFLIYLIYCRNIYNETSYIYEWDSILFKTLMNYAGWNLFGNIAGVATNQGVNILLNIFFGPIINASRGIAFQVSSAVNSFVTNFQIALNPQVVKSYAMNDKKYMHLLIIQGSKFSFYLMFLLSLPLLIETNTVLKWWLKIVPDYSVLFCRLVLINVLIDSISGTLKTAAQSTGRIKRYQAVVGVLLLMNLPISFVFLKFNYGPEFTFYVSILISILALFIRIYIISSLVAISKLVFVKDVLFKILLVTGIGSIISLLIIENFNFGYFHFLFTCIVSFISVLVVVYFFGLAKEDKIFVRQKINYLKKKNI